MTGRNRYTYSIDYVVTEDLPQLYVLEGHGEAELPSTFADQIEKANIETNTLSLLTVDAIPEEADCILIYAPSSDISTEERDMLADYVSGGGRLLVMAGPVKDGILENLYSLLSDYGVEANEGIVVEADREHYAFQAPYVLLPDMASHDITDSLIEENYFPILPISLGLTVTGEGSGGTVTELLTTSGAAFSKVAGYDLSTYEKEEGDIDGPFAVAVSVEDDGGGQMVWFTSSVFLEDVYNAYSSGSQRGSGHERPVRPDRRAGGHGHPQQVAELQLSDHQRVHLRPAADRDDRGVPPALPGRGDRRGSEEKEESE